jgi:uncharacterized protein (DUF885 family)
VDGELTIEDIADELLDLIGSADPLEASLLGLPGHDHELRDLSEEADARFRDRAFAIAAAAELQEPGVTRSVVAQQTAALVDKIDSRLVEHQMADFLSAPAIRLATYIPRVVPTSDESERAYLDRLAAIPAYLAAVADRNRGGLAAERLPVARMVRAAIEHIDRYLDEDKDTFAQPPMSGGRSGERDRLLADVVRPAFARYREVLATEIAPRGRADDRPGLCWLPDGDRAYDALVRLHTTTSRTPEQLHRTGLDLIDALAEEYAEIGSRVFGLRSAAEVQERLRTDPSL